jgi:hypothetical protein
MNCKYIFENKEYTFDELKLIIKSKYKEEFKKNGFSEYSSYIARVSLGIIKNPSTGDYNYTSKAKDIVYRGTPENYPIKKGISPSLGEGITFTSDKNWAESYTEGGTNPTLHIALINIKNPIILKDNIDNLSENEIDNYIQQKATKSNDGTISLNEYLIVEPEQIHVLGGKADIKGFKEFVDKENFQQDYDNLNLDNLEVLKYLYEMSSKSKDFITFAQNVQELVSALRPYLSVDEILEKLHCL